MQNDQNSIGPQRVLVTGGAGFIGSHLVDALVSRGFEVTILDNLSSGQVKNIETHLSNKACRLVEGDVRDVNEVREALVEVDAVFHLAAITSVPYSIENPTITEEVNAEGTRNLVNGSVKSRVKRFIYVSTCAVYGEPHYLPVDEDHPLNPMSPYAKSKITGENYCRGFQDENELRTVTLRLFNVYGLRQTDNEYSGVITKFIKNIQQGKPPIIYGDGEQTRDFIHVSDVVESLLLSLRNTNAVGQTFNIGSGKPITINKLCRLVLGRTKGEIEPVHREARIGDIKHSYASIEKARKILGFEPRISLDKGLENFVSQWMC